MQTREDFVALCKLLEKQLELDMELAQEEYLAYVQPYEELLATREGIAQRTLLEKLEQLNVKYMEEYERLRQQFYGWEGGT